jgi:hypothetical protein
MSHEPWLTPTQARRRRRERAKRRIEAARLTAPAIGVEHLPTRADAAIKSDDSATSTSTGN